ncbi:hypothetical protein [Mycolicibacterium vinylchloridicum]|uniref:hypothetical protein n=1 Tax=Mycolicibacterium vinylchloridicum TaxID=2736928 RepID=UPI0015CBB6C5|nr:hypothetical protein [Mycolicibacterium vinylchloridicum]
MTEGTVTSKSTAVAELTELARQAAHGLMKGGHLDMWEDGKAALRQRLDILEAAERAGIPIDPAAEGIGRIYTRAEVDGE